jgi:hypothetical protein
LFSSGSGANRGEIGIQRQSHVALTGDMLDSLLESFPEMIDQIIGRVTVFASASAAQTNRFLQKLDGLNRTIRQLPFYFILWSTILRLPFDQIYHLISYLQRRRRFLHFGTSSNMFDFSAT